MVRTAPDRSHPAGFSLVEVLVALVLLAVGALALAAGSTWGARLLSRAEQSEAAQIVAANVLDSLSRESAPVDGELEQEGVRLRWTTAPEAGGAVRVELRFLEPVGLAAEPALVQLAGPPPPVLRVVPVQDVP